MTVARGLERLLALPVAVESVERSTCRIGRRETTVVKIRGAGALGCGEDVTHDQPDRLAFQHLELASLHGLSTLDEVLTRLDALDLSWSVTHAVVASYRRWAIESALIDLALMQAGLGLDELLELSPRPVRFVISPQGDGRDAARRLFAEEPSLRLKVDPRSHWTRCEIEELASLGTVAVLDLKGTYPTTVVYQPPDLRLYGDLVDALPTAWFEDPALTPATEAVLAPASDRISWDEPVRAPADLARLSPLAAVNVKPSRLGSLAAVLETVARSRALGITIYGGGQSEIGPGRGQIQLLAALLYPDGPNDVAPLGYDDLDSGVERCAAPLVLPGQLVGFRWDPA